MVPKVEYDVVKQVKDGRRNIGRPTYNQRRLKEYPIPSLGQHYESDDEHNLDWLDSSNSDESNQNE